MKFKRYLSPAWWEEIEKRLKKERDEKEKAP